MTDNTKDKGLGLALKDRSPAQIRAALEEQGEDVVKQALRLHDYAGREGVGLTSIAHRSGVSSGILSQFFSGTYAGNYEEIAARIDKFFWRLDQQALYGGLRQFVQTALSRCLWGIAEKTRIIRRIQLIEGPEQVGKTSSLRAYTEENNHGRTIMVQVSGGRGSLTEFIHNVAHSVGIPYTIKLHEKRIRLREILETCDLLIIDEAHNIDTWSDRSQREFWDFLRTDLYNNGDRGILMLYTNTNAMERLNAWRRRARYNLGQLLGRMRMEIMRIDAAGDIVEDDIRLLAARYYKPGAAMVRKLHHLATREGLGHLGLLCDILNESWTVAKARKAQLTDAIVDETANKIFETLKSRKELYS